MSLSWLITFHKSFLHNLITKDIYCHFTEWTRKILMTSEINISFSKVSSIYYIITLFHIHFRLNLKKFIFMEFDLLHSKIRCNIIHFLSYHLHLGNDFTLLTSDPCVTFCIFCISFPRNHCINDANFIHLYFVMSCKEALTLM